MKLRYTFRKQHFGPRPRKRRITVGHSGSVFAYWAGENTDKISVFHEHWNKSFDDFKIYKDEQVIKLLQKHLPEKFVTLYQQVRIPAAKSDIARLILLFEYGGLYVDCHCGMVDTDAIVQLLSETDRFEGIFLDRRRWQAPRHEDEYYLINSIMFAQPRSKLFFSFLLKAFSGLECQRDLERYMRGYSPYHIGSLSGPEVLNHIALQPMSNNTEIRLDYREKIKVLREENAPIERDVFRGYNTVDEHWSQRQLSQKLFS